MKVERIKEIADGLLLHADAGLIAFADAIRSDALEEAAKVCDEIAGDCWSLYKGRAPYTGREAGRADPGVQGESDGADKCAAAIRALSQKDPQ